VILCLVRKLTRVLENTLDLKEDTVRTLRIPADFTRGRNLPKSVEGVRPAGRRHIRDTVSQRYSDEYRGGSELDRLSQVGVQQNRPLIVTAIICREARATALSEERLKHPG